MTKRRTFPVYIARPGLPATAFSCGHQHDRRAALNCAQRLANQTGHVWNTVRVLKDGREYQTDRVEPVA